MLELLGSSLFSTPIRCRFRALRVHKKKQKNKNEPTFRIGATAIAVRNGEAGEGG